MQKKSRLVISVILFFLFIYMITDLILGAILIENNFNNFRVKNSFYHHGLEKNVQTLAAWGPLVYPFYTNRLGFRTLQNDESNSGNAEKQILFLGDSHTEGVGVDYKYTFAGILQKELAGRINILNGSAVSYSPKIHYLKARYLLEEVGLIPDEIWVFIDFSDLQNEIAYKKYEPARNPVIDNIIYRTGRWLKTHSFTVRTLSAMMERKEIKKFSDNIAGFDTREKTGPDANTVKIYKDFFSDFDNEEMLRNPQFHGVGEWLYDTVMVNLAKEGLQLGQENILSLKELCSEKNIPLTLCIHPWPSQVLKGDTTDLYVESWREFCRENDISFISFYPVFINEENPALMVKTCYIQKDTHWNEMGHGRVANYLGKVITTE